MSTLKVNTVQHNTSGFNNVVQFTDGAGTQNGTLCRAWVNFNGQGTVAIRADFNVNTITDHGTGNYTVNFSNPLTDANYAVSFFGQRGDGNDYGWLGTYDVSGTTTQTASAYRCHSRDSAGSTFDWRVLCVSIFR